MASTRLNTRNDKREFTLFPNLATELKLKIWGFAVPGPRIIVVKVFVPQIMYDPEFLTPNEQARQDDPSLMRTLMEDASKRVTLSTKTKNPGLLFACKTSREISLKHLSACMDLGSGKLARIDPLNDTIILCHLTMIGCLSLPGILEKSGRLKYQKAFSEVRKLVVNGRDLIQNIREISWLASQFPSLHTLILLSDAGEHTRSLNLDKPLRLEPHEGFTAGQFGRLEEWLEYTNAWKTISESIILLLGIDSILELRDNISAIPKIPEITVMKLFNNVY